MEGTLILLGGILVFAAGTTIYVLWYEKKHPDSSE